MLRLAILSVLVTLAIARSPRVRPMVPMLDGRIGGGEPTTIEELPYQLSLLYLGEHSCGASIISTTKALTSGDCTNGRSPWDLNVRAGSSFRDTGGQVVGVDSICQHPRFDPRIHDNDVSVLRLSSPLVLGNGAQPISLVGLGQTPSVGALATVSGWGATSDEGSLSFQLQKVQVEVVKQDICREAHGNWSITDNMICVGVDRSYCKGDHGGPLTIYCAENDTYLQVGIVSRGKLGCGNRGFPGVYTDLASLSIRDHIDSC